MAGQRKQKGAPFSFIMAINLLICCAIFVGLGVVSAQALHVDRVPRSAGLIGQVVRAWRAMVGAAPTSAGAGQRYAKRP